MSNLPDPAAILDEALAGGPAPRCARSSQLGCQTCAHRAAAEVTAEFVRRTRLEPDDPDHVTRSLAWLHREVLVTRLGFGPGLDALRKHVRGCLGGGA